jgi:hypothetical protein
MRRILAENHLPEDLAYMAVVESAVSNGQKSEAGAAGMWQLTAPTAKAFGLTVDRNVDERLDVRKSTVAACKILRELILDFGAGSSVMLALAAYNSGSPRVKQGIRKVTDPIKQRNFWYLYRIQALPPETREYVPKVITAMIIARYPQQFIPIAQPSSFQPGRGPRVDRKLSNKQHDRRNRVSPLGVGWAMPRGSRDRRALSPGIGGLTLVRVGAPKAVRRRLISSLKDKVSRRNRQPAARASSPSRILAVRVVMITVTLG